MHEPAPAKINLTLHVTGRRPDGYHLLDSLVVFAGAHDRLSATASDDLSLTLGGPFGAGLRTEADNLVLRAARALQRAAGCSQGAALHLEKHLPIASGIGGGSADAAATLRLLARLWRLSSPPGLLAGIAASLGADVTVCLASQPALMRGIGEQLAPAPALPPCGLVLVNPGEALATQAVFKARQGAFSTPHHWRDHWPHHWPDAASMAAALAAGTNDLEPPAIALCPPIGVVLSELQRTQGCLLARMSGSGATCFALFPDAPHATRAARQLARPGWWCWGGALWPAGLP